MDRNASISARQFGPEESHKEYHENRPGFQWDYNHLIFSALFRKLQDKAQAFPLPESISVHNRLTHSLEVSYVGRSLGNNVTKAIPEHRPDLQSSYLPEIGFIASAACLAYDLGDPPFSHSGERAISTLFSEGKGIVLKEKQLNGGQPTSAQWEDLIHLEGNANAFHLLTHRPEGCRKDGFALTYSTLTNIVKYLSSPGLAGEKSKFGFFTAEGNSFRRIAEGLGMKKLHDSPLKYACHLLIYLMEATDNICYQTMDIENAHKLKILITQETQGLLLSRSPDECRAHILDTSKIVSDTNEQTAYLCSSVIGLLIDECTQAFLNSEARVLEGEFEGSPIKHVPEQPAAAYKHCAEVPSKKIYRSHDVLDIGLAGFRIISILFELMIDAVCSSEKTYSQLLINRVSGQYNMKATALYERIQAVLDYISGITDVFALDLYRKINGNSLPAV